MAGSCFLKNSRRKAEAMKYGQIWSKRKKNWKKNWRRGCSSASCCCIKGQCGWEIKKNLLQIQVRPTSFSVSLENRCESFEGSHMNMSARREVPLQRAQIFPLQLTDIRELLLLSIWAELFIFLPDPWSDFTCMCQLFGHVCAQLRVCENSTHKPVF